MKILLHNENVYVHDNCNYLVYGFIFSKSLIVKI